jgi:S1-C subfamily serine protease
MSFAARTIALVVAGTGAIGGAVYWKSRPAAAPQATRLPAPGKEAPAPTAPADADTRPPDSERSRAEIANDVAARVEAAYAASKAKADADKLAASAPPRELPLDELISRSLPAVVRVETTDGLGTGFFIEPDTILTNVHVVGGHATVTIRRAGGATQVARVETTAPELDIAVVRTGSFSPDQPTLTMGSSARARAGQEVLALGSPLGLQNTVTRGIVSAVRQVGGLTLVQTDAAINPGNSGGPLIDRAGQVVGITTLGMRSAVAQGLSFAVAIDHARLLLAGQRPTSGGGTPLTTLSEVMSNGRASSDAEQSRDRASRAFEQAVAGQSRRADALDDRWRSFVRSCYGGQIAGSFDRPWFALWDAGAMQGAVAPGCSGAFADIRRVADEIRSTIVSLDEAARQADVYPGTRRDVLKRYRLDNPAWTR